MVHASRLAKRRASPRGSHPKVRATTSTSQNSSFSRMKYKFISLEQVARVKKMGQPDGLPLVWRKD
jgi:hypothetical protein